MGSLESPHYPYLDHRLHWSSFPVAWSAKTSLNGSVKAPLAAFSAVNWSESSLQTFTTRWLLAGRCQRIKCGNESWRVVPIKVELEGNLQIPKLRREVSNTENCSCPVFSAVMGLRVTDLLARWRFCGGNVSWLTHDFYMTKHYLTAFNEHFKWRGKGATACTNPHPSLNQWQFHF